MRKEGIANNMLPYPLLEGSAVIVPPKSSPQKQC
jgi:hypothetical protein